jgi:hypothetical protein
VTAIRTVVLDDYQEVADAAVNWRQDELGLDIEFLHRPLHGAELLAALSDVEIVVDMRERTEFDAANLEGLPRLRLLVGDRNVELCDRPRCRGAQGHRGLRYSWADLGCGGAHLGTDPGGCAERGERGRGNPAGRVADDRRHGPAGQDTRGRAGRCT